MVRIPVSLTSAASFLSIAWLAASGCASIRSSAPIFAAITAADVGQAYFHDCPPASSRCTAVRVDEENDDYGGGTDDEYTHGIGIFGEQTYAPGWVRRGLRMTPVIPRTDLWVRTPDCDALHSHPEYCLSSSLGLVQNMYTPTRKSIIGPDATDRPYAGVLVVRGTLTRQHDADATSFDLSLGALGPASLAHQTQDFIHNDVAHVGTFGGWANQLSNTAVASLEYTRRWRVEHELGDGFNADFTPLVGAVAGNLMDYGRAGAQLRVGYGLIPNWGAEKLTETIQYQLTVRADSIHSDSASRMLPSSIPQGQGADARIEFGLIAEGEARGVIYNATVDRTPPTVDRRWTSHAPLVPEGSIGLLARVDFSEFHSRTIDWLPNVLMAYRLTRRGADMRGAGLGTYATDSHVYGVFNISVVRRM